MREADAEPALGDNEADGPTALAARLDTEPEMVARLDAMLATATEELALEGFAVVEGVGVG